MVQHLGLEKKNIFKVKMDDMQSHVLVAMVLEQLGGAAEEKNTEEDIDEKKMMILRRKKIYWIQIQLEWSDNETDEFARLADGNRLIQKLWRDVFCGGKVVPLTSEYGCIL